MPKETKKEKCRCVCHVHTRPKDRIDCQLCEQNHSSIASQEEIKKVTDYVSDRFGRAVKKLGEDSLSQEDWEKESSLFDKFEAYCDGDTNDLSKKGIVRFFLREITAAEQRGAKRERERIGKVIRGMKRDTLYVDKDKTLRQDMETFRYNQALTDLLINLNQNE